MKKALLIIFLLASFTSFSQLRITSIKSVESRCSKTGAVMVTASGGSTPYQYALVAPSVATRPNQSNDTFLALAAGSYTVRVTDNAGATVSQVVSVKGSYKVATFSTATTNSKCSGDNGKVVINKISNGRSPFSYSITAGPIKRTWRNSNTFDSLRKGTYTASIRDSCGNVKAVSFTINEPPVKKFRVSRGGVQDVSSCDSIRVYVSAYDGVSPYNLMLVSGIDTIRPKVNTYVQISKRKIYKLYGEDFCGSRDSFTLDTTERVYVNPYNKCYGIEMTLYRNLYGTLYTPNCAKYGYKNLNSGLTTWQTSSVIVIQSGVPYRLMVVDTCCKDTTATAYQYNVPNPKVSMIKNIYTNLDSTSGVYFFLSGIRLPAKVVLVNTPYGANDSFSTSNDQFTQKRLPFAYHKGDTIATATTNALGLSDFVKGKYSIAFIDTCGTKDTLHFEVLEKDLWKVNVPKVIKEGCPSAHKIYYSISNNSYYQSFISSLSLKRILPSNLSVSLSTQMVNGVASDSISSLSAGTYVMELRTHIGYISLIKNTARYMRDTIVLKDPGYPKLEEAQTYFCKDGTYSIITKTTNGIKPYKYRYKDVNSSTWSAYQSLGEFHGLKTGTYDIEVTDSCGNVTVTTSSSGYLTAPKLNLGFSCNKDSLELFVNEINGVKYRWYKDNTVISNNRVHHFKPYLPANYGNYRLQVYVNTSNGVCVDTFASISLGKNIELEGPYLWGCDSLKFNKRWIYKNGIYSDTTTSVGGCDSVMTHKVIIGKTALVNKDTTTCDSIYLLNQWITKDSSVYDTISGEGFKRDTIAGINFEGGKNGFSHGRNIWGSWSLKARSGSNSYFAANQLIFPVVDNPGELDFYYASHNGFRVEFFVEVDTGKGWEIIDKIFNVTSTVWQRRVVDLFHFSHKKGVKFRITGRNLTQGYVSLIDDVFLRRASVDCDSIIKYNVKVKESSYTNQNITECDSALINGNWYSSSGLVKDTLVNAVGCDSFVHTTLTINNTVRTSQNLTYCDSGLVQGEMFYATQTVLDTLTTSLKCDSIITTYLVINQTKRTWETMTYCDSGLVQGNMYYTTQTVQDTLKSYLNCDSIITTALNVNVTKRTYDTLTYCDSGLVQKTMFYNSQEVQDTFVSYLNCDSIVITDLTVNYTQRTYDTLTYCDSGLVQKTMFYSSQEVQDTFTSYLNCDSIVITDLTVNYTQRSYDTLTFCDSGMVQGSWYYTTQTVNDTFTTYLNCDSIVITDLTVNYSTYEFRTEVSCDSLEVNGNWYYNSQIVMDTFSTYLGCDSVIFTDVTIHYTTVTNEALVACDSAQIHGNWYYSTQVVLDTFRTVSDCDSLVYTDLVVNYTQRTYLTRTSCDSALIHGIWFFSSQEVIDTFTTYLSCDSIVYTDLTINYAKITPLTQTNCDSALIHGKWYFSTQVVSDTFQTYLSCDSVVNTSLLINRSITVPVSATSCDSALIHGNWYYASQIIDDTLKTSLGCDSVVVTDLTINYTIYEFESDTICSWDVFILPDGTEVADSGVYLSRFTTWQNCDSLIETSLSVENCNPCTVFFPTGFTINSDGVNDDFRRFGTCDFQTYEMYIYNRWGELMFETTDPNESWDGTFNGKLVPNGVYVYRARYITHEKDLGTKSGHITVLR